MKVVLLAGGLGSRMREETEFRPKPMVEIGGEPLIWHIMRNFAHHGFSDFVICSGYKSEKIEQYFAPKTWGSKARYLSGRFPFIGVPEPDWSVQVIDTGLETPTGGRLKKIETLLGDDRFFCTYGDGIAPVNISQLLTRHLRGETLATVTLTHPTSRFGIASVDADGLVTGFREKPVLKDLVSIGFFVFESKVLESLDEQSVLEEAPLARFASSEQLNGYVHDGFWQPIDTYRELLAAQKLWEKNSAPWVF